MLLQPLLQRRTSWYLVVKQLLLRDISPAENAARRHRRAHVRPLLAPVRVTPPRVLRRASEGGGDHYVA